MKQLNILIPWAFTVRNVSMALRQIYVFYTSMENYKISAKPILGYESFLNVYLFGFITF